MTCELISADEISQLLAIGSTPIISVPIAAGHSEMDTRWTTEAREGTYVKYDVQMVVSFDPGRLQMPVACEAIFGTKVNKRVECEILQVHSPFGVVKVTFNIMRNRCKPVLPAIVESTNRFMTMPAVITVHNPMLAPDGLNLIYQVTGEYHYALLKPLKPEDVEILFPRPTAYVNDPNPVDSFSKDIAQ